MLVRPFIFMDTFLDRFMDTLLNRLRFPFGALHTACRDALADGSVRRVLFLALFTALAFVLAFWLEGQREEAGPGRVAVEADR